MNPENQNRPEQGHRGGRSALARALPAGPPEGRPLDTSTNNSAAPSHTAFLGARVDQSTGEVLPRFDPLRKWGLQAASKRVLGQHRIAVCMAHVRHGWDEVQVRQALESGRAYYAGLLACGSVWVCPVCASKIQQVRAEELRQAIAEAESQGLSTALLTLTVPHTRHDVLGDLVRGFSSALGAVLGGRAWKKLAGAYGLAGYVRSLEVTWGEASGWHPHAHVALFLRAGVDLGELADRLFPLWQRAVAGRGLGEPNRAAFALHDGSHVSRYVTKLGSEWGISEELVRGHTKSASGARFSPFDLLGEVAYGEHDPGPRSRFAALFREYAATFHGRRQLQWSQGLKRRLLTTDGPTDGEIADSLGHLDPILSRLTLEEWAAVRARRLQGTLLLVAEMHGAEGVASLLSGLRHDAAATAVTTLARA